MFNQRCSPCDVDQTPEPDANYDSLPLLSECKFPTMGRGGEGGFKKSAATRVKGPRHSKRDLKWRKRERRGLSPSEKEQKDTIRRGKRFGGGWENLAIWPLCL